VLETYLQEGLQKCSSQTTPTIPQIAANSTNFGVAWGEMICVSLNELLSEKQLTQNVEPICDKEILKDTNVFPPKWLQIVENFPYR